MSLTLSSLIHTVGEYRPRKLLARRMLRRCAVNLLLRHNDEHGLELLMIQRAERDGDPWSGHMGFPGGRHDEDDANIYRTAMREMHEEIGIDESQIELIGRLSDLMTRSDVWHRPMVVTPFVCRLKGEEPMLLAKQEVAKVVWIPLRFLADTSHRQSMPWKSRGLSMHLPCYVFDSKRVWGLSLSMIDELLRLLVPDLHLEQYDSPRRR